MTQEIHIHVPDAPTNEKKWRFGINEDGDLVIETRDDSDAWGSVLVLSRTGTAIEVKP